LLIKTIICVYRYKRPANNPNKAYLSEKKQSGSFIKSLKPVVMKFVLISILSCLPHIRKKRC